MIDKLDVKELLPNWYDGVYETDVLMSVEDELLEELRTQIQKVQSNQYVSTADSQTLTLYEKMLNIAVQSGETLEERRFHILSLLQSDTPYTYRQLEKLLANLCGEHGYEIQSDYSNYNIKVSIILPSQNSYEAVKELLDKIIPANLTRSIEFLVRPSGAATVYTGAAVLGIYMSITAEVKNYGMG